MSDETETSEQVELDYESIPKEELVRMFKATVDLLNKEIKKNDVITQSFKWTSYAYWRLKGVETIEARDELWKGLMKTLNA